VATISWISTTGGDWSDGANWQGGVVPGASDDAVMNLTNAETITISSSVTVHSVAFDDPAATYVVAATGTLDALGGVSFTGDLIDVYGTISAPALWVTVSLDDIVPPTGPSSPIELLSVVPEHAIVIIDAPPIAILPATWNGPGTFVISGDPIVSSADQLVPPQPAAILPSPNAPFIPLVSVDRAETRPGSPATISASAYSPFPGDAMKPSFITSFPSVSAAAALGLDQSPLDPASIPPARFTGADIVTGAGGPSLATLNFAEGETFPVSGGPGSGAVAATPPPMQVVSGAMGATLADNSNITFTHIANG
jgi:hypothetical protein